LFKRLVSETLLVLLLIGFLASTFNIRIAKSTWTGTVYIRADGRVDPPDAPINTSDRITYKLVDYITSSGDGIIIERDNIILDGNGYGVQGAETYESKGIILSKRANITVRNIYIFKFYYGVYFYKSSNNRIFASWIMENKWYGIHLEESNNNCVFGNNIIDNDYGVYLSLSSSYNNISRNNIEGNFYGIILQPNSNYNTIYRNIITKNICGIEICSSYNLISENEITANSCGGICFNLPDIKYNNIIGNSITQNGYGIRFVYSSSHNVILANNITANKYFGIYLYGGKNNSITKNFVTNTIEYSGILASIDNSDISENIIANNRRGVELYGKCNTIAKNTLTSNSIGIYLYSSNNTIFCNNVTNNIRGIYFSSANFNDVFKNVVKNNNYGITLHLSSSNKFYHNNFIENSKQVVSNSSINIWDDGYPSGGNYWSDYTGMDVYSGPYQNETGNDGIGDTPYVIDSNNQDRYPLMYPYGTQTYKLIITTTSGGTTSPSPGTYIYTNGTIVKVIAIPEINYTFSYWELDGVSVGSENPIEVLMDSDHTLHAVFTHIPYYKLSISTTLGGTTNPPPGTYTYVNGTVVIVTAIPNTGFSFEYWLFDGEKRTENPITVIMDSNHTLHAVFVQVYTLTITSTTGGTTNPAPGTYTYPLGSLVNVTAMPSPNYRFERWLLDGADAGSQNPISILMDSNHTLHAVFTQITYQLSITATAGGTTNPAPGIYTYVNGTQVVITAVPYNGFSFDYWLLDGVKTTQNPITIIMNANHTLEAHFADVAPPIIDKPHQWPPPNEVEPDMAVLVDVNVTDRESGVNRTILSYTIDNGLTWNNITMELVCYLPCDKWFYTAEIPGMPTNTLVKYKIIAYDNAGNYAIEDNAGQYYVYTVIPEYPSTVALALIMLTTLFATALLKTKRKRQHP